MSGLPSKKERKALETLLARKLPLAKVSWGGGENGKHGRVVVGQSVGLAIHPEHLDAHQRRVADRPVNLVGVRRAVAQL